MTAPFAWGGTRVGEASNQNFATKGNPFGVVRLIAAGLNINANLANTDFQLQVGQVLNFSGLGTAGTTVTSTAQIYPSTWVAGQSYMIQQIQYNNPSTSLTTATAGVFSAVSAGGVTIVTSAALSGLTSTAVNAAGSLVIPSLANQTTVYTQVNQYFRIGTAQGAAATVDVYVMGVVYP
jgi:hypothetical protein